MDIEIGGSGWSGGSGSETQPFGAALTYLNGALQVREVKTKSAAAAGGLKKGDVVLSFPGAMSPSDPNELRQYLRRCEESATVASLRVDRKSQGKPGRPKKTAPKRQHAPEETRAAATSRKQASRKAQTSDQQDADRAAARERMEQNYSPAPSNAWDRLKEKREKEKAEREEAMRRRVAELTMVTPQPLPFSYADVADRSSRPRSPTASSHLSHTPTASPRKKRSRSRYAPPGSTQTGPGAFHTSISSSHYDVVAGEVSMRGAAAERPPLDFNVATFRDTQRWNTDGPTMHSDLLGLGTDLNVSTVTEAVALVEEWKEGSGQVVLPGEARLEFVPPIAVAMMNGDVPMPILPPLPAAQATTSLSSVFIGRPTPNGYDGHYLTMVTSSTEGNVVHLFDSLPNYTRNPEMGSLYTDHLAKVGAAMKRLDSTLGLTLRFHNVPHQQNNNNSCGAYSLLNLVAVAQGLNPASLQVLDETVLRKRIHDHVYCQPFGATPEITSLLYALEDAGAHSQVEAESNLATSCGSCNEFPAHYGPDGVSRVRRRIMTRLKGTGGGLTDAEKQQLKEAGLRQSSGEEEEEEEEEDEEAESDGSESHIMESSEEEEEPANIPQPPPLLQPEAHAKKPASKARKRKPLGSAELMPLKRTGVPKEEESLCPHCKAWLFAGEAGSPSKVTSEWCCGRGRFVAPRLQYFDAPFYKEGSFILPKFMDHARTLNNMNTLAMTGVSGKWMEMASGTSMVKIQGKCYHRLYDQSWSGKTGPRNSQLCILDPQYREKEATARHIGLDLVRQVTAFLMEKNPLLSEYQILSTRTDSADAHLRFKTVSRKKMGPVLGDAPGDPHDLMPRMDEVCGIISTEECQGPREVVVYRQTPAGRPASVLIKSTNPIYEALAFPLMRPFADASWKPGLLSKSGKELTLRQYQMQLFLCQPRTWELGRLGQELVVDAASRMEEERLGWLRHNQECLRMGSRDEIAGKMGENGGEGPQPGNRIYLPTTFTAGPRYYRMRYLEGMAIILEDGNPDLFITVTCNPKWKEIRPPPSERHPARPTDCPGIITRVFKQKLGMVMHDVKGGRVFGSKSQYDLSVIEYQKRGLPHSHILLKLKKGLKRDELDNFVTTAIPSKDDPELLDLVLTHMIHGPCGDLNPDCVCMDKEGPRHSRRCTKSFPKPYNDYTHFDDTGFPVYRRVPGETAVLEKGGKTYVVDSRWVVPYNPDLLRKYKCHINVELASGAITARYLYKYITKGSDRALTAVAEEGQTIDEISDYENKRIIGAAEAHWRMYGFHIMDRNPSVQSLTVHLPGKDRLLFKSSDPKAALERTSQLQRYFNRPEGEDFDELTFCRYYSDFRELSKPETDSCPHPDGVHFVKPRVRGRMITRMHWVANGLSELYYLRLLLSHFPARSFEELCTVRGIVHETFQEAARALNLAKDGEEYMKVMVEAAGFLGGHGLRNFFTSLIIGDPGTPARHIWNELKGALCEDFVILKKQSKEEAENSALIHLSRLLQSHGRTLQDEGLPECKDETTEAGREPGRWERQKETSFVERWTPLLSEGQRRVVDTLLGNLPTYRTSPITWPIITDPTKKDSGPIEKQVLQLWKTGAGRSFRTYMLLAPGGSGKTVTLNYVVSYLRSRGLIALCVASTGIAALNYPGGITAHSMFKLPFDAFDPDASCSLSMRSQRAEMIRRATAIVFDEAVMLQRNSFRAFFRLLEDIRSPSLRFVVFAGDLMQIPPVIKHGTKDQILAASIRSDPLWKTFTKLHLNKNLRAAEDPEYAAMCSEIGAGTAGTVLLPGCSLPLTPLPLISTVPTRQALTNFVYPTLRDPYSCLKSAILAGTNEQIDGWNEEILAQLPGKFESFYSADHCEGCDDGGSQDMQLSTEVLATMGDVGVPPHHLRLKLNTVAILMRNTNFNQRLANSLKVIIREILPSRRIIMVEIPSEDGGPGPIVPIHRVTFKFQPGGKGMEIVRCQFPLRPALCLTHNKGQGQTLNHVGIDLSTDVFAHGHLYVDVSRVRSRRDIRVLTDRNRISDGVPHALNIVYQELLDEDTPLDLPPPLRPISPSIEVLEEPALD